MQTAASDVLRRRRGPDPATLAGYALLAAAAIMAFFSLQREVDFDEANYLNIAKSISRTGLPYLTSLDDLGKKQVFITSPPLVMAVASVTQLAWPHQAFPSRLVHVLLFTLPVYFLVWHIARKEYGPVPACFALLALVGSLQFLAHGCFVRLDVPLALFSLLTLWCFYRAIEPGAATGWWSLLAGVTLGAAVAAKYQAICIPAGIGLFLGYLLLKRDYQSLRRTIRPLAAQACAGVLVLAALYTYLYVCPAPHAERYAGGVADTLGKLDTAGETWHDVLLRVAVLPLISFVFLGWSLLAAGFALLPGRAPSRFSSLLVCYCIAVGLFNLAVAKLCGAGTYYLLVMIPPLAILVGRAAAVALEQPRRPRSLPLTAAIVVLLAWGTWEAAPWTIPVYGGHHSRYAEVAACIEQADPGRGGVLAENMAIEFFSDRPTGMMQYMPYPALLDYLDGRGPYPVRHVVLRASSLHHPDRNLAPHWNDVLHLLRQHFEPMPSGADGIVLLVRK